MKAKSKQPERPDAREEELARDFAEACNWAARIGATFTVKYQPEMAGAPETSVLILEVPYRATRFVWRIHFYTDHRIFGLLFTRATHEARRELAILRLADRMLAEMREGREWGIRGLYRAMRSFFQDRRNIQRARIIRALESFDGGRSSADAARIYAFLASWYAETEGKIDGR